MPRDEFEKKIDKDAVAEEFDLRSPLPVPVGNVEVSDNAGNWFELATKNFVLNSINYVKACRVATTSVLQAVYADTGSGVGARLTSNINEVLIIDGVTVALNDRVLVKDETDQFRNGIYVITQLGSPSSNWIMTRASDYDSPAQIKQGDIVSILFGALNSSSSWMETTVVTSIGISGSLISFSKMNKNGLESVYGTTNQIQVAVSGDSVTLSFFNDLIFPGSGGVTLPVGSNGQRPSSPRAGMLRFNNGL